MIQNNIESLEDAAENWCKQNNWLHAYYFNKGFANKMVQLGANWQKEQYKDLIQSHERLLIALTALVEYVGEGGTVNSYANEAIEKANSIINQQK